MIQLLGLGLVCLTPTATAPPADPLRIAVAASFAEAAEALGAAFRAATGREVVVVSAATGLLYAQIAHGAPFDILLAADTTRPAALEQSGRAVAGSRRPYAVGRLALWSASMTVQDSSPLFDPSVGRIAIAKPETAPYGAAAHQVLERIGAPKALATRAVRGENVSQTYQVVRSRGVALGFVTRAAVRQEPAGSQWLVPAHLHDPLVHEAVLLRHAERDADARAFLDFLRSDAARVIIRAQGYDVPAP